MTGMCRGRAERMARPCVGSCSGLRHLSLPRPPSPHASASIISSLFASKLPAPLPWLVRAPMPANQDRVQGRRSPRCQVSCCCTRPAGEAREQALLLHIQIRMTIFQSIVYLGGRRQWHQQQAVRRMSTTWPVTLETASSSQKKTVFLSSRVSK